MWVFVFHLFVLCSKPLSLMLTGHTTVTASQDVLHAEFVSCGIAHICTQRMWFVCGSGQPRRVEPRAWYLLQYYTDPLCPVSLQPTNPVLGHFRKPTTVHTYPAYNKVSTIVTHISQNKAFCIIWRIIIKWDTIFSRPFLYCTQCKNLKLWNFHFRYNSFISIGELRRTQKILHFTQPTALW